MENRLNSVSQDNIKNYFCKARQYIFGYLKGFTADPDLDKTVKKYKKLYKSHCKINITEWQYVLVYMHVKNEPLSIQQN